MGVSSYAFANGDPIDLMDPFGLGAVDNSSFASKAWNVVSGAVSSVAQFVGNSIAIQNTVSTIAWNTTARAIGNAEGLVDRDFSGSPIIDGPVSGYLNYVFAPGEPAVIGPNLAQSLQNLAKKNPLQITSTPTNQYYQLNATSKDNLIVNTTLQNFRYTNDGTTTTVSDYYAFPTAQDNHSGGTSYYNAPLHYTWGLFGTPYRVSGSYQTPKNAAQ